MAAVAVAALLTGCGPKEEPTDGAVLESIRITPSSISLLEGETYPLRIKYTPEEAKETAPAVIWYSERQRVASVDDKGLVTADRVGTTVITAQCGKLEATCTVEVLKNELPQPEPDPQINFSLSTDLIEASAKGGTFDITVTTDEGQKWTAKCEKSWAQLSQTEGEGSATLQVTVDPADTESTLTQNITFKAGKGTYFVTVRRKGNQFSVSPETIDVPANGGSYSINVTSNISWTASCEQSWAKLDKSSGDGDATVKVTVDPATETSATSQRIVFKVGGNSYYVTIRREGKDYLTIDKSEIEVPVTGGTYIVNVSSSIAQWNVSEQSDISDIVTITKSGNQATITVSKNMRTSNISYRKADAGKRYSTTIFFSAGELFTKLTLKVEEPYLYFDNVTNATLTINGSGDYNYWSKNVTDQASLTCSASLKSNISWKVNEISYAALAIPEWEQIKDFVTVSPLNGTGDQTISVVANFGNKSKTYGAATIGVYPDGEWSNLAGMTIGFENTLDIQFKNN